MNRLIMIYGCVLLSSTAIAAIQGSPFGWEPLNEMEQDIAKFENQLTELDDLTVEYSLSSDFLKNKVDEPNNLDLSTIEFVEQEVIELGFDPYDYLPEDFDPHTYYFDLSTIEFDEGDDLSLGFDTAEYLPLGFDPYAGAFALSSIHFMEDEGLDLGFDAKKYLPQGFSPYEPYFDLSSIHYIEMDDDEDDNFLLPTAVDHIVEPF